MSAPLRILVCHRDQRDKINTWLDHHPELDLRGGGGDTFSVQTHVVGGGPNDVHYIAGWRMPDDWFSTLLDWLVQRQWNVNVNDVTWDFSWYGDTWTLLQVYDDLTRKPYLLEEIIPDYPVTRMKRFLSWLNTWR